MNNYIAGFVHSFLQACSLLFFSVQKTTISGKSYFFRTLVAMGMLCMAAESHSAVITYNESIDGDLLLTYLPEPSTFNATNVGTLGIGINTVSGITSWDRVNSADFDGFVFTVAPGTQLITSQIYFSFTGVLTGASFTLLENTGPDSYGFIGNTYPVNNIFLLSLDVRSPFDVFSGFADVSLPLTSGNYAFFPMYVIAESIPGGAMSYTWELQVAAVPLPSAFYLLGSGLVGLLGFMRWYKAR